MRFSRSIFGLRGLGFEGLRSRSSKYFSKLLTHRPGTWNGYVGSELLPLSSSSIR